jgi:hypothetical protein
MNRLLVSIFVITLMIVEMSAQITFSKDWRPGGKRSDNYPCEQMADMAVTRIRELIRVSIGSN